MGDGWEAGSGGEWGWFEPQEKPKWWTPSNGWDDSFHMQEGRSASK